VHLQLFRAGGAPLQPEALRRLRQPDTPILDLTTGERTAVARFAAVLGASNYTYAEANLTQQRSQNRSVTCPPSPCPAASPRLWFAISS
jgi:hypothetical protein